MAAKSFPVLFVAPEGVSEAVLASGLLRKLHDEAPNPRFTIVANRQVAPLYADMPKVEQLVVTERRASGRRWFGILGPVRAQRWALVVDMPSGVITGRLRPKGKALRRSHDEPAHKLLEAARLMRLEEDPPSPYLFVNEATETRAAALTAGDAPILAVAPTAEWVGKAWPIERFAEATRRLLSPHGPFAGGRLMILGEKADAHEVEPVRSTAPRDLVIDLVGKDPLTAYAALRRARLYIGNDTGFSQLAAAAGAPTLALFGPSDDRIWRPWGENVRVVRGARTLEEIRRVDSSLSAQVRHMIDLSADSVLSAAESLLEETAPQEVLRVAERFDLIVRGGEVVNHAGRGMADIGVRAGRIAAIGDLSQASAGESVDATGLTVLPGVIDTQVHFREPGMDWKEDLEFGSRAAVMGGVTAVFEMPNTDPPTSNRAALEDKLARAKDRMHCDHAFYAGATHENAKDLAEIEATPGCCGVKTFMGASTGSLLVPDDEGVEAVLRHVRRRAAFHSEDEERLAERRHLAREGDWTSHEEVRDAEAALKATRRLIAIADRLGKRVHVLHTTTADEIEFLAHHKDVATCEVTPQHLTLSAPEAYQRLRGLAQMNPPIRGLAHQAGLWRGIANGVVDVIGTDHAPHTLEEKARPYPASPSGMPGVQTLVAVMLTHVAEGRLTLERFVDLTSAGAQRIFGIAGKGRMAVGWDADLTIVDLKARRTIRHADMATRVGWTPFDGMQAKAWPMATIIRGQVVMRDGELSLPGQGRPIRFLENLGAS